MTHDSTIVTQCEGRVLFSPPEYYLLWWQSGMVGGFNEGRLMRIRSSRQINENNNCHVLYTAVAIHTDSLLQTAEHLVRTPYAYERKFSFHTRLKTKFFAVFVCVRD